VAALSYRNAIEDEKGLLIRPDHVDNDIL
jgi:hypothetical protein